MKKQLNQLDQLSRRQFVARTAKTALGVSIVPLADGLQAMQAAGGGKAEHCIFFYMQGGMSQFETFDPKPGKETGGPTEAIKTGVAGIELSAYMPNLAKRFKDIALVRSMTQKTGDHKGGTYWMHTSYQPRATIVHPTMGPWAQTLLGKKHATLPDSIIIGGVLGGRLGAGFFGPSLEPLPIRGADRGVPAAKRHKIISEDLFEKRVDLMNDLDSAFRGKFKTNEVDAYTQFYNNTLELMQSEDLEAFELKKEKDYEAKSQRYGKSRIGQGAMLAKRLVSSGIRFIEVTSPGWDMHGELWDRAPGSVGSLDKALGALIDDLKAEGLLEKTLIVVGTEFGRTPNVNTRGGRDHYPRAFSALFAGGGVVGGQVYGTTDELGKTIVENPVTPGGFNATIGHALGLDLNKVVYAPSGRPFLIPGHKHDPKTGDIIPEYDPIYDLFS